MNRPRSFAITRAPMHEPLDPTRPISKTEFDKRYRELAQSRDVTTNQSCVSCVQCTGCVECQFCSDSQSLTRCTFNKHCKSNVDCSHCERTTFSIGCTHAYECDNCSDSQYIERSIDLKGCSYCFGCVALRSKEFHILNQPYKRDEYFLIVRSLGGKNT